MPISLQKLHSAFMISLSPGFTLCAHSVQLPSYKRLCCVGKPASVSAASIIAAVTPVPQLLMMGFEGSMPLDLKTAWSSEAGRKVLSLGSRRSVIGTGVEYGICPEERPMPVSTSDLTVVRSETMAHLPWALDRRLSTCPSSSRPVSVPRRPPPCPIPVQSP